MQKLATRIGTLVSPLILLSCAEADPGGEVSIEESESNLCYRGERRFAQDIGGDLVIEGDILVAPADRWCRDGAVNAAAETGEPIATETHATRPQGDLKWPNGRMPFIIHTDFTPAENAAIRNAMTAWSNAVPGISFSDHADEFSYVVFVKTTACNSSVGRVNPNLFQIINLSPECAADPAAIQHEIGHALGLEHEQNRKDRASFITVNWGNVRGCPNLATSAAQCTMANCSASSAAATQCACKTTLFSETNADEKLKIWKECSQSHNFVSLATQSDIGDYNYTSLMHYSATSFAKPGTNALTGPVGQVLGAASISDQDARNVQALYPVLQTRASVFASAGIPTRVCDLKGRERDAATKFRISWPPNLPLFTFTDHSWTFPDTTPGIVTRSFTCEAQSYFWGGTYDYPNSSTAVWNTAAAGKETWSHATQTVVMTAGLAPIFL